MTQPVNEPLTAVQEAVERRYVPKRARCQLGRDLTVSERRPSFHHHEPGDRPRPCLLPVNDRPSPPPRRAYPTDDRADQLPANERKPS